MGQLWQSKLFLFGNMPKDAGFQESTLSDHCMTTGFGPFELLTCGLLQRGQDHSLLKACIYSRSPALSWLSKYEHPVAKQNGGGAEWVELYIYNAN